MISLHLGVIGIFFFFFIKLLFFPDLWFLKEGLERQFNRLKYTFKILC